MKIKKRISSENRKKVLKEFFLWEYANSLAEKYWYTVHVVKLYLDGRATKTYIDSKWIEWRRCSNCRIYKKTEFYDQRDWKNWKIYISNCKICYKLIRINKRKILKNNRPEKLKVKDKKFYDKRKNIFNIKRKVKRIIWYTDNSWRVLKKN